MFNFIDLRTMKQLSNQDAFDILFKNFFESDSFFGPITNRGIAHPVDIFEDSIGLQFEIACTGLSKEDVTIEIVEGVLKISHQTEQALDNSKRTYYTKNIAKRSFNLGYKVTSKFDLTKASADMKNGLLKITVPYSALSKPTVININ